MSILKIILIILLLIILFILFVPVGVYVDFNKSLSAYIKILFIKIKAFPREKGNKKKKKSEKKKKEKDDKKPKEKKKKPNITVDQILDGIPYVVTSLKKGLRTTRKRIVFEPFDFSVIFAGDDPAKTAQLYGKASTVMWTCMPEIEKVFRIPDPHIHLDVDFEESKTDLACKFGLKIRLFDILVIGIVFAIPLVKYLIRLLKSKKKNNNTREK